MARPAQPEDPAQALVAVRPDGRRLRLHRGVREPGPRRGEERPHHADDHVPGLVAGGLRALRAAHDPDGLAQRGHLPHRGRPRRCRRRDAAVRPAEQLARQREPRQGAPAAVAGQAEVRPLDLVGRPHGAGRQRGAGVDGPADLRVRRRATRRLGARRGRLLGPGVHLARRRALHRRPRAREPAGRGADGPDLRQPGGPQRGAGPARLGPRHPRDVPPDGDERRGDRRADRRRPHVRQDPRRRGPRRARRRRARGRAPRGAGPGLEELLRQRQGPRRDHQRHRGHLDRHPGHLGQQLLRDAVRLRVGADEEPRGREPVAAEGQRRREHRAGPGGRLADPPADHAHHRPRAAGRPGLRADLAPVPGAPGRARRRVRAGVVQADPPRHGPDPALPRPRGAAGDAAVAGPRPGGHRRADRSRRRRRPEAAGARLRTDRAAAGRDRVGVRVDVPGERQAGRRQRRPAAARAAERLGGQHPGRAGAGAARPRGDPAGLQRRPRGRGAGLAGRPDRARRLCGRRAGREGRRPRRDGARSRRVAPTRRRSGPTSSRSPPWSRPPTGSATTSARGTGSRRSTCCSTGRTC